MQTHPIHTGLVHDDLARFDFVGRQHLARHEGLHQHADVGQLAGVGVVEGELEQDGTCSRVKPPAQASTTHTQERGGDTKTGGTTQALAGTVVKPPTRTPTYNPDSAQDPDTNAPEHATQLHMSLVLVQQDYGGEKSGEL